MKFDEEKMHIIGIAEQEPKITKKTFFIKNYINKKVLKDIIYYAIMFILCFFLYLNINHQTKIKDTEYLYDKSIFNILKKDDINFTSLSKENLIVNTNNEEFKDKFKTELEYLQHCLNGTEIKSYNKFKKPKLSIIVPIHNKEIYIDRLLRSIQNQNWKEIEIIFIDDYSKDNGTQLLEEYSRLDKRITIIKNRKYEGTLSSFVKGINEAKADYSLLFNPEDMLLSNLKYLYNISINKSKDINDFSYFYGKINNIDEEVKMEKTELYQPHIREILFLNYYREASLSNKIMKTSILKSAVKTIKKEYLKPVLEYHWDKILFLYIFSRAKSYISFPDLYIQFHTDTDNKYNINKEYNELFNSSLYLFKFLSELNYTSNKTFNLHINYANDALQIPLTNCGNNKLEVNWKYLNKIVDTVLINKNLDKDNKQTIKVLLRDIKKKSNNKKNDLNIHKF